MPFRLSSLPPHNRNAAIGGGLLTIAGTPRSLAFSVLPTARTGWNGHDGQYDIVHE